MVKSVMYLVILCLTLSSAHPAFCALNRKRGDIVAARAGVHKGFHRLVIELRAKAEYSVKKTGKTVELDITNVDSRGLKAGYAGTKFFRIKKVTTVKKEGQPHTTFFITLNGMADIRDAIFDKPVRIIVDMYPKKIVKHPKKKKKVAKKSLKKKAGAGKKPGKRMAGKSAATKSSGKSSPHGRYKRTFAFNEGWRWIYRKMAVEELKTTFYGNSPEPGLEMLSELVPQKGRAPGAGGVEVNTYLTTLEEKGDMAGAETLKGIISLIKKNRDLVEVERDLIKTPENNLMPMAHFLLASRYEREGLYPESSAYYGMAYEAKTGKKLKAMAALGRGRVLFFSGHVAKSLKWFERARKEGSKEARGWLAGSHLLKGEFRSAWAGYKRMGSTKDPLSLMGMGDMKMMRGDYDGARLIFKGLRLSFVSAPFLMSFFASREADALMAGGAVKEGLLAYSAIKKQSKGEALALSGLALGDYYAGDGGKPLLARDLYKEVAKSATAGSGEAYIRLATVLEALKDHSEAMKTLSKISPENTISTRREIVGFLRSKIAYNWIADLYGKKQWLDIAMVNYRYGAFITFGKRAENWLRVGEALMTLGLTPDAVVSLNRAEKIGRKDVKVKAVLLLTRLYLDQRDGEAAAKILADMRVSSPEAAKTSKWRELYMEAEFLRGNYEEVIGMDGEGMGGEVFLMRAAAYRGLGKWSKSMESYSRAVALFKGTKDKKGLMEAETGYADSLFASRGFEKAIVAYREAAEMAPQDSKALESWLRYRLSLSYAGAGEAEKAISAVKDLKRTNRAYGDWAEVLQKAQMGGL